MEKYVWAVLLCLGLCVTPSLQQIPLDMLERLSQEGSATAVLEHLVVLNQDTADPIRPGSPNPNLIAIVAGSVASPDACEPKITSVEISRDEDPNVVSYPSCVAMPQCGGCGCGHDMLECGPVEERMAEVLVMKMRYPFPGAQKFDYLGLVKKEIVEHERCACRCKVQSHHCHPIKHVYEEHSCRCKCRNNADAILCPAHQMWSNEECACVCPNTKNYWCLEDEFFSNNTCRCEMRSSFVKIVDIQGPGAEGPCAKHTCRPNYRAVRIGDICHCTSVAVSGVQAGSLGGGDMFEYPDQSSSTRQQQEQQEQEEQRPSRPISVRPTRPRQQRPGAPIRQTGGMIPLN